MYMFLKRNALPCVDSVTSFCSELITNRTYSINTSLDPWVESSSDIGQQRALQLPAEFRCII